MMPQSKGFRISKNQSHDARVGGIPNFSGSPLKIRESVPPFPERTVKVSIINMYKPPDIL
jgi:hypothetical protein